MMAIAKYLPRDEFALTVCALRPAGLPEASAQLGTFGAKSFVAAFRPTSLTLHGLTSAVRDQHLLRLGGFDIQHSLDFTSSPFEGLWARAQGRRFVFTQRNLNEDGHPRLLRLKIRLAAGIIAISTATESLVRSLAPSRTPVSTIPLGFDFDELAGHPPWSPSRDAPIVLAVGHLQRRKRIEDAIHAVALVRQRVPNVQLWVAGGTFDRGYERELIRLADELGISANVRLLGVRADVLALMSRASALLHCAASEAFGWSLLEAMAVGLPVVSCRSGGTTDLIQHGVTGFVSEVGDYAGCSQHLCRLLEDEALATRVSRAAGASARAGFAAEAFADRHASFYRTCRPTAVAASGSECRTMKGEVAR
jgi:glycosyltransferase involved in cell wall biosynthesis